MQDPWEKREQERQTKAQSINLDGVSDITKGIIQTLIDSDRKGREEYGATVDREDFSALDWLDHEYSELTDAAKYNRAARREVEKLMEENRWLKREVVKQRGYAAHWEALYLREIGHTED